MGPLKALEGDPLLAVPPGPGGGARLSFPPPTPQLLSLFSLKSAVRADSGDRGERGDLGNCGREGWWARVRSVVDTLRREGVVGMWAKEAARFENAILRNVPAGGLEQLSLY